MNRQRSTLQIALLLSLFSVAAFAYPTARTDTAMAFDATTKHLVLYGGATGFDANGTRHALGDTWEWTGRRWIQIYTSAAPPARFGHSMVHDSNRARIVLFGGANIPRLDDEAPAIFFDDTWVFERGNWKRVETPAAPPARHHPGAAFDPLRDRLVVFGGNVTAGIVHDTWEFDGTTWTLVNADGPKLTAPLLVFDKKRAQILLLGTTTAGATEMYRYEKPNWVKVESADIPKCTMQSGLIYQEHNETVLFVGGRCPNGLVADEMHEWNGTKWTKLANKLTQGAVYGFAIGYDLIRNETVMYGGFDFDERSLTIRYRDGNFIFGAESFLPGPRSLMVLEGDPDRGVLWLYGGHNERGSFADLWKYADGRWESVQHPDQPASCSYPLGVYDTNRKRLVLLCEDSSTFEWDGETWTKFPDLKDRPPARRFASIVYDATLKKTVLFGGYAGNYLRETWTWDGTKWTKVDAKKRPNPRSLAAMFYDPISKKTLVFGGIGRPNNDAAVVRYSDMWSFDGSNWTEMTPAAKPPVRYGAQGEVDPATGNFILFGGKSEKEEYLNELWEWNGTTWAQLARPNTPSPRMNVGFGYDFAQQRFTLFGGYAGGYFSELWTLGPNGWTFVPERTGRRRASSGR